MNMTRRCEVRECDLGKGVFAVERIGAGEVVVILEEVFDDRPGRYTIQVDEHRHQAFTDDVDDYLNHSCRPTARLEPDGMCFVAVRPIEAGEEVTFHYGTTEWDMAEPFTCGCDGTPTVVRGFRHLSAAEQEELGALVPAWLWARRRSARRNGA